MKKILCLLHLPPPVHGSAVVGKQVKDIFEVEEGIKSVFINLATSASVKAIGKFNLIKIITYVRILSELLKQLLFHRPNFVYFALTVQGIAFFKDAFAVILIKLCRVPLVFHLHNKGVSAQQSKFPYKWLYPLVFANSNVILLSKFLYPDISRFVLKSRVNYCPNGLPEVPKQYLMMQREQVTPSILFLSNLIESKGILLLLEACGILKEKGVSFRCVMVGGEGDVSTQKLTEYCNKYNIVKEVSYEGKLLGDKKHKAFAEASIFCLPSFYHFECLPLVLIEAMQWSLPIVSTNEGGIPDLVKDGVTGFMVAQRDPKDLADKLEQLIKNPDKRIKMGKAGREHYLEYFTEKQFNQKMASIFQGTKCSDVLTL